MKKVSLYLSREFYERLCREADQRDMTLAEYIRALLYERL